MKRIPMISTDESNIDELLERSVDTVYPSKEELKQVLLSGKKLRVYCGWDATGPAVHLGHAINYSMLKRFHELGHEIIVLVGDFTAMIGDPTDKRSARVRLSKEQVEQNLLQFKEQIAKVLPLEDSVNPIRIEFNSSWLGTMTFSDVIDLASNFTVQNMIERETFQKRIKEEKPLYVHEFMYPLMQGYDSVALDVDVEIGGTDQTFNMLAGRTLQRRINGREKFVITHPLLENPETGEVLMSKSKGTGIFLSDGAEEMYRKTMMIPDAGIVLMFEHCTEIPLEKINKISEKLSAGENPRDIKMLLAREIVRMYHGEEAVQNAEQSFISAFREGGMPDDAPVISVSKGEDVIPHLISLNLIKSSSEWRRLVDGKGVVLLPDTHVTEYHLVANNDMDLRLGKKKFVKIRIR